MRPAIDQIDLLLDIHSMYEPHGPVMLSGPLDKGIGLAKRIGFPEHIVADRGHANGTRLRDYGAFGDPNSPKNALLVECGQHWEHGAADVAWQTIWQFLLGCGTVDVNQAEASGLHRPLRAQSVIRVTEAIVAKSDNFTFASGLKGLSQLDKKGELIGRDDGRPIVAPYDNCVLIMPALLRVGPGLTAVRLGRREP
jgi:hypothetical protein